MNKNNNTQMQASSLVKFNFNNKDYLVYFIDENKENKQRRKNRKKYKSGRYAYRKMGKM